jgi:hypothetical protein
VAHAPGERFRAGREDEARIEAGVPGKDVEPAYLEYHGRRISAESGAFPLAHGIPAKLGLGEPALRRMALAATANWRGRLKGYGNAVVPELAAKFVRSAIRACEDVVNGDAVMSLMSRDETKPHNHGLKIDPSDPNRAAQPSDGQRGQPCVKDPRGEPMLFGSESDPQTEASSAAKAASPQSAESFAHETPGGRAADGPSDSSAAQGRPEGRTGSDTEKQTPQPADCDAPRHAESFARETLPGPVVNVSGLDDQALVAGMDAECEAIRMSDRNYPGRYHRLGTYAIESNRRFGEDAVRSMLRAERISRTVAHWAVRIAELYTYEQAVQFPSARAIIKTLPPRQPRRPKEKPRSNPTGGGDRHPAGPLETPPAANDEDILDRFVRLGIEVKETLGDAAFDKAVEQIRAHVAETFEDAFAEVMT